MYVESHDQFSEVGLYDADSGTLERLTRDESRGHDRSVEGHFANLANEVVILYRDGANLYVGSGERKWRADTSTVHWESEGEHSTLAILEDGREVFKLVYRPEASGEDDVTPFGEPEDWDFGRFIFNVLNDPSRAARIYRNVPM